VVEILKVLPAVPAVKAVPSSVARLLLVVKASAKLVATVLLLTLAVPVLTVHRRPSTFI